MTIQQIPNPGHAFASDPDPADRFTGAGGKIVQRVHNVSSANPIQPGMAVIWSTNSTDGTGVVITTVAGSPLIAGVALTSMTTGQSTDLSSNAAAGTWGTICVGGLVPGVWVTTVAVPGDQLGTVATTASTIAPNGGFLGPIASTQVAGSFFGVAGIAFTSGTTATITGTTMPLGTVLLRPQVIPGSTL